MRLTAENCLRAVWVGVLLLCLVAAPNALAADSIKDAVKKGKVNVDLRYRYEAVDQDSSGPMDPVVDDAKASTLRLRLGYQTGDFRGFFGYADFEALRVIGAERYNSTSNGLGTYPVVPDPEDEEINQAYLGYRAPADTLIKLGRQRIALGNLRFIGNVGWRQNEQTYDALSIASKPTDRLDVYVAHINNVNRIFGEHHPVAARADTNLFGDVLQVGFATPAGKLTGYAHLLEFEDSPAASHRNIGLRFAVSHEISDRLELLYQAEVADQSDYKDAPSTVDAGYMLAQLGLKAKRVTVNLGYEVLEGDGVYAFQTPLATLHAFNGWADKFLTTPAGGLVDSYIKVGTKLDGWGLTAVYHDFEADVDSTAYGSELGFAIGRTFKEAYLVHLKYASYDADTFSTDTDKLWFTLRMKL